MYYRAVDRDVDAWARAWARDLGYPFRVRTDSRVPAFLRLVGMESVVCTSAQSFETDLSPFWLLIFSCVTTTVDEMEARGRTVQRAEMKDDDEEEDRGREELTAEELPTEEALGVVWSMVEEGARRYKLVRGSGELARKCNCHVPTIRLRRCDDRMQRTQRPAVLVLDNVELLMSKSPATLAELTRRVEAAASRGDLTCVLLGNGNALERDWKSTFAAAVTLLFDAATVDC